MKRYLLLILGICLFFSACAKKPEKLQTVNMDISQVKAGKKIVYKVKIDTQLVNENHSTAVLNYKGKLHLVDNDGQLIRTFKFNLPEILPFTYARIVVDDMFNSEAIKDVLMMAGESESALKSKKVINDILIREKNISLEVDSYETKDIIELLKGKADEKK